MTLLISILNYINVRRQNSSHMFRVAIIQQQVFGVQLEKNVHQIVTKFGVPACLIMGFQRMQKYIQLSSSKYQGQQQIQVGAVKNVM